MTSGIPSSVARPGVASQRPLENTQETRAIAAERDSWCTAFPERGPLTRRLSPALTERAPLCESRRPGEDTRSRNTYHANSDLFGFALGSDRLYWIDCGLCGVLTTADSITDAQGLERPSPESVDVAVVGNIAKERFTVND